MADASTELQPQSPRPYVDSPEELLGRWHRRLRESQFSQFHAAEARERAHLLLGVPAIVLSTIVGTSVFASLEATIDTRIKIVLGTTSVVAAVLSALQTFLRFPERAEQHRRAGARFGAVRREVETLLAVGQPPSAETLTRLRRRIDRIVEEAPTVPTRIHRRAEREMERRS